MAKIDSYATVTPPVSGSDLLIGTDVTDNNATKNFTVSQLASFINAGSGFVPYTGATQNVNIGNNNLYAASSTFTGLTTTAQINVTGRFYINGVEGSAGQVLTSQGSGSPAVWATPSLGYNVYTATISQSGTTAPTVNNVFKNTFTNTLTWNYAYVGRYTITNSTFDFTSNKTIIFINPGFLSDSFTVGWEYNSATQLTIHVKDKTGAYTDGLLFAASIELRVYN